GKANVRRRSIDEPFEIELVHARRSHLGWGLFELVLGVLLVWKLAIVGQIVGVVFLGLGAWTARNFVMTLLHPPGTIAVGAEQVTLPLGLCRGKHSELPLASVKHVFFLRRAVPWTRAAPVLVVETAERAFAYPRDWFASEADQRMVLQGLNKRILAGAKAA
ncbi:MAG TPA: hypothetical protein VL172_05435, partial [Kofleriaceae bacterium]|nr:hypothetical protein [Kofleriaceae bacterium]